MRFSVNENFFARSICRHHENNTLKQTLSLQYWLHQLFFFYDFFCKRVFQQKLNTLIALSHRLSTLICDINDVDLTYKYCHTHDTAHSDRLNLHLCCLCNISQWATNTDLFLFWFYYHIVCALLRRIADVHEDICEFIGSYKFIG